MGLSDIIWVALIIAGAVYILYRSLWKKKGHCSGCSSAACEMKRE